MVRRPEPLAGFGRECRHCVLADVFRAPAHVGHVNLLAAGEQYFVVPDDQRRGEPRLQPPPFQALPDGDRVRAPPVSTAGQLEGHDGLAIVV